MGTQSFDTEEFYKNSRNRKLRDKALRMGLEKLRPSGSDPSSDYFSLSFVDSRYQWTFDETELRLALMYDIFHADSGSNYELFRQGHGLTASSINHALGRLPQYLQNIDRYQEAKDLIMLHHLFDEGDTIGSYNYKNLDKLGAQNSAIIDKLRTSPRGSNIPLVFDASAVDQTSSTIPSLTSTQQEFYNWIYVQLSRESSLDQLLEEFQIMRSLAAVNYCDNLIAGLPDGYKEIVSKNTIARAYVDFMTSNILRNVDLESAKVVSDKTGSTYLLKELFIRGNAAAARALGQIYEAREKEMGVTEDYDKVSARFYAVIKAV